MNKEYIKCNCGHIVEVDMNYKWNNCSKCGCKITVTKKG